MHVGGAFYSVSLTGVEFEAQASRTELTYTEQIFLLTEEDVLDSRIEGTEALMDKFTAHLAAIG